MSNRKTVCCTRQLHLISPSHHTHSGVEYTVGLGMVVLAVSAEGGKERQRGTKSIAIDMQHCIKTVTAEREREGGMENCCTYKWRAL